MRSTLLIASLVSLSSVAVAQGGYGRFPCTIVNGDGSFSGDQTQCASGALVAPGSGTGGDGIQGDGIAPTSPVCTLEGSTGAYFCGIQGAICTTSANCDNGVCTNGVCTGGFGDACASDDTACLGYLYCQTPDFLDTAANTCGAVGAFCQDPTAVDPALSVAAAQLIFNNFCATGYCSSTLGACATLSTAIGGTCADDPDFQCGTGLVCDSTTNPAAPICVAAPVPSGRARARRNKAIFARNLCPTSHTACAIEGASGFECIDINTNIEQCGACQQNGGVDCSAIRGVEAVGCVSGQCEIWSCAQDYTWNSETSSCE